MELDELYENYVLEDHTPLEAVSEVKVAFDLLRSKLNKLALHYHGQQEFIRLVDSINDKVGDSQEQYEQMLLRYFPGNHKGIQH